MTKNDEKSEASIQLLAEGQKEWLTPDGLWGEYQFSKSTQAKYRMARKIPFVKIGRYIRYSRTDINQWLEDNKIDVA